VSRVVVEDLRTHELRELDCDGVFIFAGMQPNLELFTGTFARDRFGYLEVDPEMRTSVPRVFAAGDIVSKRYRQMTTAVADGTIAAITIAHELATETRPEKTVRAA
jgi:thioredoxin reductase (NADPH)